MLFANQEAAAVSWLACGSPTEAQSRALILRLSSARASSAQKQAACRFLARARSFARRGALHLRCGSVALASQIPFTLEDATSDRLRPRRQATPAAPVQPCAHLIAERVSLPTARAIVPVAPWLPPAWRDRLARPDGLLRADCRTAFGFPVRPGDPEQLDAASVGRMIPQPTFLIRRSEYRKLLGFLRQLGLVTFRDPRTLPKHPVAGKILAAGTLDADKKRGAQRMLLDRRPLNAIEDRLIGASLLYAGDFVRIELGPGEVIRTSLRDGKDQYYVLYPGDARVDWQAFGQPVDPD